MTKSDSHFWLRNSDDDDWVNKSYSSMMRASEASRTAETLEESAKDVALTCMNWTSFDHCEKDYNTTGHSMPMFGTYESLSATV